MDKPAVSLATYTYNDGEFVDGLLASIDSWTISPNEIILVDDGSASPYVPPKISIPIVLLRHETNQGIPRTKHESISAASSAYVMAIDCDTRVASDWLETALSWTGRKDLGMISGPVIYASGNDLVSRFQRRFGDNHNVQQTGETDFIPGNVFLMHRDIWRASRGFQDFKGEVCEDHHLCKNVKKLQLKLWIDERAKAAQVRKINRIAMVKRYWKWCGAALKKQAAGTTDIPAYIFSSLAIPHSGRIEAAIEMEEPLFVYLELLYLSYAVLDLLDFCALHQAGAADLKSLWWRNLSTHFKHYKLLWAFLRADLAKLDQTDASGQTIQENASLDASFTALLALKDSGLFEWLSGKGIQTILDEERSLKYNFSFYETTL